MNHEHYPVTVILQEYGLFRVITSSSSSERNALILGAELVIDYMPSVNVSIHVGDLSCELLQRGYIEQQVRPAVDILEALKRSLAEVRRNRPANA